MRGGVWENEKPLDCGLWLRHTACTCQTIVAVVVVVISALLVKS